MRQLALNLAPKTPVPTDYEIVSHNIFEKLGFSVRNRENKVDVMHFDNTEDAMKCVAYECGYRSFDYEMMPHGDCIKLTYSSSSIEINDDVEILVIDRSTRFIDIVNEQSS